MRTNATDRRFFLAVIFVFVLVPFWLVADHAVASETSLFLDSSSIDDWVGQGQQYSYGSTIGVLLSLADRVMSKKMMLLK